MKKFVFAIFAFFAFASLNAQGLRGGVNLGIPVGDVSDFSGFYGSLDLDYDWAASESINVGAATGFGYYFGKDGFDGFKYLPIAGSVDVGVSDDISVGGDVGYAVSLESGGGGDFMYRFQVRFQLSEDTDVSARMNNISGDGVTFSSITAGFGLRF